jgi:hypothetical protein
MQSNSLTLVESRTSFYVMISGLDETSGEFLPARKGHEPKQLLYS